MKTYTWCLFYNLLAHKLLGFKNNRKQLIEIIKSVFSEADLKLPTLEKDNNIIDIDPFTVFGLFNKGITEANRKTIIAALANKVGITDNIPDDFSGIPVLNNLNATFYGFINDRNASDIDDLWQLFEEALKYADSNDSTSSDALCESINKAVAMKGNGNSKITMGLFWIASHKFLNLDSRNYWYIYESGKLPQEFVNTLPEVDKNISAEVYFDISRKITEFLQKNSIGMKTFVDLSAEAWNYSQEINDQKKQVLNAEDKSWFPTDYTPGFTVEDWVKLFKDPEVFATSTLEIMARFQDFGGVATCKQLSDKYGESANFYNSGSSYLAKRIHEKTNCPVMAENTENSRWWPILYLGRYNEDKNVSGVYIWKLRPELAEALKQVDLSGVKLYADFKPAIWKISHGPVVISEEEYTTFEKNKVAVVHGITGAKGKEKETQGEKFIHKIQKGDYFYLCRGNSIRLLGQFDSDKAVINPGKQDDWYQRSYKVIAVSKNTEPYTGASRWWTPNNNSTCYNVDDNKDFEDKILKPYFGLTLADLGQNNTETMSNPMIKDLKELLLSSKQLILTGAPGSGKTYLAKQIAQALTGKEENIEFCQFHPSFDYTDFVEGLRPVDKGNANIGFERRDGIFKAFCKKALKNYQDSQKSKQVIEAERSAQDKIDAFLNDVMEKQEESQNWLQTTTGNKFKILNFDEQHIFIEIPGNEKVSELSLSYQEILKIISENIPITKAGDIKNIFNRTHNRQSDSYVYIICSEIKKQKNITTTIVPNQVKLENFVFIIDEINRGDISKIFGELFYAVDPGYRGKDGKVTTQYDNLIDETDLYYGGFYIPKNVYIIGTMNDIDRSVESMDFAIRRRFTWKEIEAKDAVGMWDDTIPEYKDEAFEKMARLNEVIEQTESLSKAFHIGPAYFLKLKDYKGDFQKLWDLHIMPLLKEYLRGTFDTETALENLEKAYSGSSDSETEE